MNIAEKLQKGIAEKEQYEKLVKKLKKADKRKVDTVFHDLHDSTFQKIDCLGCANCCKTTSPIFRDTDIKRLAKRLKMKEAAFIDQYLHLDNEGDYVLNSSPCSFLDHQNYCMVYEDRPLACREYPHTNRKNMYQILSLTRKNMEICPGVSHIMEEILRKF